MALERYHVRLPRDVVRALEIASLRVSFIENRPVTWADLVRRGCELVLRAEGQRPLPNDTNTTPKG